MQQIFSQEIRFKQDDGSDYPDWEIKKLNEICKINPKSGELPDEFIYIDLESVEKGCLKKEEVVFASEAPSRAQRILLKNDILYQTVRPYQRNNLFSNLESENYVASTGYAQIRAYQNSRFLYHYLHTDIFVKRVMLRCTGTSYPAINSTDLSTIKVLVPVNDVEQQKIANFLTEIDTKINQVEKQLSDTQQFKRGLLQQMFV